MTKVRDYKSDKCHMYVEECEGHHVLHLVHGVDFELFKQVQKDYRNKPLLTTTPIGHRTNRLVSRYADLVETVGCVNIYHIRRQLWE